MTKFESAVKVIPASQKAVYEKLSDLSNLEKVKDRLPQDKVKNLSFDAETLSIEVPPVGKIVLQIVEKEPCKCIKFATTTSPLPFNLWIQIVPVTETECKMKLTIGMELNPFMKTMVQKPLQEGLEKMAETYFEGVGWVPVDQSFGIPAFARNADEEYFFLGGIDSWRMIVNTDYGMPLVPEKKYPRSETVDFQRGEVEWEGGNLYFPQWSYHMDIDYLNY